MSPNSLKPWSQLDDEGVEITSVVDAPPNDAAFGESQSAASGRGLSTNLFGNRVFSRIRLSSTWALAPLGLGVLWAVFGMVAGGRSTGIAWHHGLGLMVCMGGSGAILIISRKARQAALAKLRQTMQADQARRKQTLASSPLGAELGPIWQAVEAHSSNVERRIEQLMEERKGLALQLSLAEACKRQSESILISIAEPVLVTDSFDQLALFNPASEELFGITRETAIRKPISEVLSDEKLIKTICHAREADSRAARRRTEHEIGGRLYSVALSPVADEGPGEESNARHGVAAIFHDVTKDRQASKHKSEFVAHVAHELRTPLASIRAYVELLVDGEAADEKTRKEYYDIIQSSAERLGRLIDNMLNISRIEAGTVRINREPVAIAMIVKEAADMLRPQAEEKGVTLTEEMTPVVYRVMADRDLIHEAIVNLLSNAIKYTPASGKVCIRMMPQEQTRRICIEVSDTGAGIPEADLPHMFEKFFRVEANKNLAKGTGLGLSLVKQIVETVHGGEMTLQSEVGKGSTFGMILPLA